VGDDQEDLAEMHTATMAPTFDGPNQVIPRTVIRKRLQQGRRKTTNSDLYDDMVHMEIKK